MGIVTFGRIRRAVAKRKSLHVTLAPSLYLSLRCCILQITVQQNWKSIMEMYCGAGIITLRDISGEFRIRTFVVCIKNLI